MLEYKSYFLIYTKHFNALSNKKECECDVQEVLVVRRSLNKAAEQQQSPFWRTDQCAAAAPLISSGDKGSESYRLTESVHCISYGSFQRYIMNII